MAVGSGLAGQFGFKNESTYATAVTVDHFLDVNSANVDKLKNVQQGGGLAAGRPSQLGIQRQVVSQQGGGSFVTEVRQVSMGLLLNALMGGTVTPVQQGVTTAYLQTFPYVVDALGKSLTLQVGVPNTAGTVNPYTYAGTKVTSVDFSCSGPDGMLLSTWNVDVAQVTESQGLAAASYPTTNNYAFNFGMLAVKLGTFGSEAVVNGVTGIDITLSRPQNTGRFYAGATVPGTKAEPITNDNFSVTGTLNVDLVNKADFADRFANDSSTSMKLIWTSTANAGTAKPFFFEIDVPMTFFDGETPGLDGPDLVNTPFVFTGQYDGTNAPATITYQSTDVTL